MYKVYFAALFSLLLLCGCKREKGDRLLPLYKDLAHYHLPVSTSSKEAQKYFDQGMALYYGFNHEAAILSFKQAGMLDSTLAMAWWGQAISAGPNINNPAMDSSTALAAWKAIQQAKKLSPGASDLEQALINALSYRYAWPLPEDRKSLDIAYADAMRGVWKTFPKNSDAGTLFADAMMNLRPWDLWTPAGIPQPGTPEIVATLEKVMAQTPDHPGACHFYVHTMEASPTPEKAEAAADRLGGLIPGAGHLVHMPSHIYIRLGRYKDAITANQKAIISDTTWIAAGGFYTLYRAHNYHFLAYAAMFDGQKAIAMQAANDMTAQLPLELVRQFPDFLDGFLAVPTHVMVRFGLWEDILRSPSPASDMTAATAFWHYGRTVSLAALDRVPEAVSSLDSFRLAFAAVTESRLIGNNTARTVLEIGLRIAEGEVEYRKGNYDKAFSLLKEAVQRDDSLKYDEPWGWMMPARHALGALLLEQGRIQEAEAVYRKDLEIHKNNGWALKGLASCLRRSGREAEAAKADAAFKKVWARSDIDLHSSCFCSKK